MLRTCAIQIKLPCLINTLKMNLPGILLFSILCRQFVSFIQWWACMRLSVSTYVPAALSRRVQVGFYGGEASVFALGTTAGQGKHTQGGWSRAKSVPELFLTSAQFKDQRAHITKRGETGEMRRLRRISPCCYGIITADMRLISGDRRRRGACASASACSGLLRDSACSIRLVKKSLFSYCGIADVFLTRVLTG